MTSDRPQQTPAMRLIDQVTRAYGPKVDLADLDPSEFVELLKSWLDRVDVRELRGFKPLRSLLSWSPNGQSSLDFNRLPMELEYVDLSEKIPSTWKDGGLNLNSQTLRLHLGNFVFWAPRYRRLETEEITEVLEEAREWGNQAYLASARFTTLVMSRTREPSMPANSIFEIKGLATKVPHKKMFLIETLMAEHIPVERFQDHYGAHAPRVAWYIFDGIRIAHYETLQSLRGKVESMSTQLDQWERLMQLRPR